MSDLLDCVKEISIEVIPYKDISFWQKTTNDDFPNNSKINKTNFRTEFYCPSFYDTEISIYDDIKNLINDRVTSKTFKKHCTGKDDIGRCCIAGYKFNVKIEYD